MYKVEVVDYAPKAEKMAEQIQAKLDEMEKAGFELVSLTETTTAKAILVFKSVR